MNYLLNINKNILNFSLIILIIIPILGFKLFVSFLGNILILLFLFPLLLLMLGFIVINSYKSRINTCNQCGEIDLGFSEKCLNCGADLVNISQRNQIDKRPSETTIEIKAEEIK